MDKRWSLCCLSDWVGRGKCICTHWTFVLSISEGLLDGSVLGSAIFAILVSWANGRQPRASADIMAAKGFVLRQSSPEARTKGNDNWVPINKFGSGRLHSLRDFVRTPGCVDINLGEIGIYEWISKWTEKRTGKRKNAPPCKGVCVNRAWIHKWARACAFVWVCVRAVTRETMNTCACAYTYTCLHKEWVRV